MRDTEDTDRSASLLSPATASTALGIAGDLLAGAAGGGTLFTT